MRKLVIQKLMLIYLVGLVLMGLVGWWLWQELDFVWSLILGSGVVGLSFFSLLWCGRCILGQKGLVKVAFVIVVKYVFIGALLVWAFQWPGFWVTGFLIGLGALFPLLAAFWICYGAF